MHLSDEEKKAILEESQNRKIQEDFRFHNRHPKISLAEYMDFLQTFSGRQVDADQQIVTYRQVII